MKSAYKTLVAAMLLLSLTAISRGQATAPARPPAVHFAVLNIIDLFNTLNEEADGNAEMDSMQTERDKKIATLNDELSKLQERVKNPPFRVGTDQAKADQDAFLQKAIEVQSYKALMDQKVALQGRLLTAEIYHKIMKAIEEYAQANGIALVFVQNEPKIDDATDQRAQIALILTKSLLYADPAYDITSEIRKKMNTEYEATKNKKAP